MGTIVQFAERLAEDGDWTPAERSTLRDMGAQLAEATQGLDLVFGQTEEGDPWCVVADQKNEVLLHVARIGGAFVVHSPRDDEMVEEYDLWKAVTRVLGGMLRDRRGVVLPFPPDAMGQPAALALILAAAVRGDFRSLIHNSLPAPAPEDRVEATPMPPVAVERGEAAEAQRAIARAEQAEAQQHHASGLPVQAAQAAAQGELHVAQGSGLLDGQSHPAQAAAQAEAVPVQSAQLQGQGQLHHATAPPPPPTSPPNGSDAAGSSSGSGGAGPPAVLGSDKAGADLGAAGIGQSDNAVVAFHTVPVQSGAVARGRSGTADLFVLSVPVKAGMAATGPASLGTVENYSPQEGDQIVFSNGAPAKVVSTTPLDAVTGAFEETPQTGQRIGYDLDGDGKPDAYLLIIDTNAQLVLHKAADTAVVTVVVDLNQAHAAEPPSVTFTGVFIGGH